MDKMGEILKNIIAHNFHVANIKMMKLSKEQVTEFCKGKESSQLP